MENYILNILGERRYLPIVIAPSGVKIAGFNPVGDMKILTKSANDLTQKMKKYDINCDVILTTELKGLPIAQQVAYNLNCDYVCLRKEHKCYMANSVKIDSESITSGKSEYYITELDRIKLKKKNVVFVDDVFSTGSTFNTILNMSKKFNFNLTCGLCILKEDIEENKDDESDFFVYKEKKIFYSGFLPLQK